jgi:ABC-type Na+ efflux pump permease subunit
MNAHACDWLCDAWTVLGKELTDLAHATVSTPTLRWLWLLLIGVFGIALPWQTGPDWLESPQGLLLWLLLPIPLVVGAVAESVAGEREHHTLEPLLATRLPIRAMLAGKIVATTGFGWLGSAIVMLAGLVVVNIVTPSAQFQFYSPAWAAAGLGLGLLAAFFAAGVGISVSLHTATVRRAYVAVTAALLVVAAILAAGTALLLYLRAAYVPDGAPTSLVLTLAAALLFALADLALFALASRQCRRTHLLAD